MSFKPGDISLMRFPRADLREGNYYESDEIKHGFILDHGADCNVIGIEILEDSLDFRSCPACTPYSLPPTP